MTELDLIETPNLSFMDYMQERRFSILDFFFLCCMLSIPGILFAVVSHWFGV